MYTYQINNIGLNPVQTSVFRLRSPPLFLVFKIRLRPVLYRSIKHPPTLAQLTQNLPFTHPRTPETHPTSTLSTTKRDTVLYCQEQTSCLLRSGVRITPSKQQSGTHTQDYREV